MSKPIAKVKNLSDGELVSAIRLKNRELYQEIVDRYQRKIFIYIYRLVGNKEEAEDILQNVFVKTYRSLKSFDVDKKFSSWIYRIAHNESVNFLKRRSQKRFISWEDMLLGENTPEVSSGVKSPEEIWEVKEKKIQVDQAIRKLPLRYQEVLFLRYSGEKSYQEISRIIKKPVNTVGTLINRAKKKLFQVVKSELKV